MAFGWTPQSLRHRIVLSVVAGLASILLLYGLVALWTLRESTRSAYAERVTLATALAYHVSHVLTYDLMLLEREVAQLDVRPGTPLDAVQRQRLANLYLRLGMVATLTLADASGTAVWTEPERADIAIGSPLRHPSVQLALTTGRPQVSEWTSQEAGGTVFACLAVPLRDAKGQLSGVLMAEIDPANEALHLMPSSDFGAGIHAQLVNSAGILLAGSASPYFRDTAEHMALLSGLLTARTAGYRLHTAGSPFGVLGLSGHIVAYAPIPVLPSWGVVIEQPRDALVAAPRRLAVRLGAFGVLAVMIAAVVTWSDVTQVVRPIVQLTAAAERFASGRLDTPVDTKAITRTDEVGILARSFETMRHRLRASLSEIAAWNRELESRVAARTAEVEARSRETAVLYARLQARERERAELLQRYMAGQEEERRQLAQELHDETSQALATLRLGLERMAADTTAPTEVRRLAYQLQGVAAQTLAAVHRLAVELRPSVLDDVGLVAAIERSLQECARRTGITGDLESVGVEGLRLIPAAEAAVYRITQAALTNVVQHAQAKHVSVLLERRGDKLVVVVEDDGRGFDLEAVRNAPLEKRLGLAGMEERAALIGAVLTIETAPGAGSSVFLEVPLELNVRKVIKEKARGQATSRTR